MYACTWVLQGINPLLAAYVCCLVDVKRVQQQLYVVSATAQHDSASQ
jgi:hypothetical protein